MNVSKRRHNWNIRKRRSPRSDVAICGAKSGSLPFAHKLNMDTYMDVGKRRHNRL